MLVRADNSRNLLKLIFQKRSKKLSQRTGKLSSLLDDDDSDTDDNQDRTEEGGTGKTEKVKTPIARVTGVFLITQTKTPIVPGAVQLMNK